MKDGEMVLIAQPLLGSRIGAYLECLAKENNKPILPIILLESQETIPTSRVSLASTLCTQGLFYPVVGAG